MIEVNKKGTAMRRTVEQLQPEVNEVEVRKYVSLPLGRVVSVDGES